MTFGGLRELVVWQKTFALTLEVYEATKAFPREELYGLVSQLRRAAVSVAANIAEGYERQHRKEYLQFLAVARGSLGEVETYPLLAKELKYVQETEFVGLESKRSEIGRLLRGLARSLSKSRREKKS